MAIGLVALAALMALLGAFGWDLTGAREGSKAVKAVGTVTTTEGAREGGAPAAPVGAQEGSSGKGVGQGMPSVDLAGGGYVPASSASASPHLRRRTCLRVCPGVRVAGTPDVGDRRIGALGVEPAGVGDLGVGTLRLVPRAGRFLGLWGPRRGDDEHRCCRVRRPRAVPVE